MKKLAYMITIPALVLTSQLGRAQTASPAAIKPNQTTPATSAPPNSSDINKAAKGSRTDTLGTKPQQGTSIMTAPGTPRKNKKSITKTTTRKKTTKPE